MRGDKLKITGTLSYVKIEYDGKIIKVQGEMIVGGFIAYKNTMKTWEPPHQNELFNEDIKCKLISAVKDYCKDREFTVDFE